MAEQDFRALQDLLASIRRDVEAMNAATDARLKALETVVPARAAAEREAA